MRQWAEFLFRHSKLAVFFGLILALIGGYYSVLLYQNLRPDLEEMLPKTARSVRDLNEVTRRFRSIDSLVVLLFSKDTKASRRFVDDLATHLQAHPQPSIARIQYRMSEELDFFKKRQALYLDLPDLILVRDYISEKLNYEQEIRNPLNIFSGIELDEPRLDLKALQKKYNTLSSTYSHFPGGYFATQDEKVRAVMIFMTGKLSGTARAKELKNYIESAIQQLNPKSYAPDLKIAYTGEVESILEENAALVGDLQLSAALVTGVVSLALLLFFRSFRGTAALLASLFMGTAWTLGSAYFVVGYLNANSAFLGSIVVGNGINFGIIFLARFLEEYRKGVMPNLAILKAMTQTAKPTFVAAGSAGLSYASLILTDFRGFSQFGVIGLIGMGLCWISAYTILPALLTLARFSPVVKTSVIHPTESRWTKKAGPFLSRWSGLICGISLLFTAISVWAVTHPHAPLLESDLSKVRSKESMRKGSGYYSKYVDEIFKHYLTPLAILARSHQDSLKIAKRLKSKKREEGKKSLIASVQTVDDFIPTHQPKKIEVLQEIRSSLPRSVRVKLSSRDHDLVQRYLTPEVFQKVSVKDLPPLLKDSFTEKNGVVGRLVLVEPPLRNRPLDLTELHTFVNHLRTLADSGNVKVPVAGSLPISADVLTAIERDGPRAALFAFLAVVMLLVLLFRNLRNMGWVLFSLIMGVSWLAGSIFLFQIRINFLNFVAIPITFGIGVDYSMNLFQRFEEEGTQNFLSILEHTGTAVALCSFTTIIGYGSLLVAQNQALNSFGLLAVLGELTCITAAVIALPAWLVFVSKFSKDSKFSAHPLINLSLKSPQKSTRQKKKAA